MPPVRRAAARALLGAAILAGGSGAGAAVSVVGGGLAQDCYRSAMLASTKATIPLSGLGACDLALDQEVLGRDDLAGSYVNRGVIYLAAGKYARALKDFDVAVRTSPQLADALVNRGAALVGLGRDGEAVAEIDRGLALDPDQPEKAYFNRAVAKERLNDLKGAYFDYRRALELKPDWDMPKVELARFTVAKP